MNAVFQKVIIIEEDPVEAGILEFYLGRAGVEAVTVSTSNEALQHVDPVRPYGILTEAHGDAIDWQELAEATLGYPSIFMILSDSPLSKEEEFRALRMGIADIFVKPVDPKTVVERLRLRHPLPLGSGSVGVPPEGFGGDLGMHHAQKLIQFARRHDSSALIEIEMGAQFGGILIKDGHPIDAWIEGFRGRSALNAILMLEEAPFVYFALEPDADELKRPNVIGEDGGEEVSELTGAGIPETRNLSHYDTPALSPEPPPVPAAATKKKKRRRFSKTGGMTDVAQVAQVEKKKDFSDTIVEETTLDDLQIRPARERRATISVSPNDTIVASPPPLPTQPDPPATPPPLRERRNTSNQVATATVAHVQFSKETPPSTVDELPIMDSEAEFFIAGDQVEDDIQSDLEQWDVELGGGSAWFRSPALAKGLLALWVLLTLFVVWRLVEPNEGSDGSETAEVVENPTDDATLTGLQLLREGNTEAAHERLEKDLLAKPHNVDALTGLGLIAFDYKEYPTARKHLLTALKADGKLMRLHWHLGHIAKALGDEEAKKKHWKQFSMVFPEDKHLPGLRSELD
jgi:Tfp pilus assembly protein PilF/CheY-like chemotaxis protein